jgi:hypothetical protein
MQAVCRRRCRATSLETSVARHCFDALMQLLREFDPDVFE